MYESVLYQTIEYVIAPIGLMMFLFYVKNVDVKERTFRPSFKENGIESLFIASYSHVLYYFSVTAHADGDHGNKIIEITKSTCLMSSIIGLILIFILKYHSKIWGLKDWKSKISTNTTALLLMLFLFLVICFMNFQGWHFDLKSLKKEQFIFITYPNNFLFIIIAVAILFFQYKLSTQKKGVTNEIGNFLEATSESENVSDDGSISLFTRIAESRVNPNFVRVDAHISKARILKSRDDTFSLKLALEELDKAKNIAVISNFPENLMYGIRKIKIEILFKLYGKPAALAEISEIEKQNSEETNSELIEIRKEWIKVLNNLITNISHFRM